MRSLDGKVAIVTGGASGLGRATAERFATDGARVLVADIDAAGAEAVVTGINKSGGTAAYVGADVTSAEQVKALCSAAVERFGGLDILVANAAVGTAPTPLENTTEDAWDRTMAINTKGVFLCCREAVPLLKRNGGGSILITASTVANRVRPGYSAYAASKAAVISLARVIALEVAGANIRVNCLAPVAADTPMLDTLIGDRDPEEGREALISTIPLGRLAQPNDVASAAAFLASEDAAFITGCVLPVDGGREI